MYTADKSWKKVTSIIIKNYFRICSFLKEDFSSSDLLSWKGEDFVTFQVVNFDNVAVAGMLNNEMLIETDDVVWEDESQKKPFQASILKKQRSSINRPCAHHWKTNLQNDVYTYNFMWKKKKTTMFIKITYLHKKIKTFLTCIYWFRKKLMSFFQL